VVVPFRGSDAQLGRLVGHLGGLRLGAGDTVTVADNRPGAAASTTHGRVRVLGANDLQTSYHARNTGAAAGTAAWLVFLDADVAVPPDLLDRYFEAAVDAAVGVLAGAVLDEMPAGDRSPVAQRYAWLKSSTSQAITLGRDGWAFAQTANVAVRRSAFEQVGGFVSGVRSGGDADLCFRLRAAGWTLERRDPAVVTHRNRATVPRMLAQRARHGAGAAWLSRRWPDAFPRRPWPGLAWWTIRRVASGVLAIARGDRDTAIVGLLDGPAVWAFELGRLAPNRRFGRSAAGRGRAGRSSAGERRLLAEP
jgi:Glycosyltransferase like family 2